MNSIFYLLVLFSVVTRSIILKHSNNSTLSHYCRVHSEVHSHEGVINVREVKSYNSKDNCYQLNKTFSSKGLFFTCSTNQCGKQHFLEIPCKEYDNSKCLKT
ncbi:unnamed protein product [Caenorhabditis angaria]|uniref:Uncharacterized protein n=1 Tax=Caenorhabditis angaria TaxID=860376 RepID=A0A9P1N8A0_9PELO|nr:unnamed protein product [Caenorhabditis angaria]